MAVYGSGNDYDITFVPVGEMLTNTSQYKCVGIVPGTTTSADKRVDLCGGAGGTYFSGTATAYHCIGVNQSLLSASSNQCSVRIFGIAKVACAESISAGQFVMPYWGVSTTTMAGRIVSVDDGVTCTVYGTTVTAHCVILGRALESGSTGTVISVFVNPHMYDMSLVGTIGIT